MNVSEIESDPALLRYGAALSFAYLVTAVFMLAHDRFASMMSRPLEAVCWPYFESCWKYRALSNLGIRLLVIALGLLSVAAMVAFLRRKARFGYYALAGTVGLHALMIAQDFRNTQNQYYMLLWTVLAYLFWPRKRSTLHYLIASFYFWAGRLKLNPQWLSGQGLYNPLLFIPDSLRSAACGYAVFLEMAMIWGLVSRNRAWFWATLAQLLAFHIVSYSQIGPYYPVLMLVILMIYPLARVAPVEGEWGAHWRRLPGWSLALIAVFAFFQLYPSLASRDRAFSGTGRTFALNMFEARYDCDVRWVEHRRDGRELTSAIREELPDRLRCEPIYYYEKTLNRCREAAHDASFEGLDFEMDIALRGERPLRPLARVSGFCSHPPGFNLFLPNSWIVD